MRRAFTLIEVLVVLGVVALLSGLLLPALAGARGSARATQCLSNLRQLAIAWTSYAGAYADRAMPLAAWEAPDLVDGQQVFWWGTHGTLDTPPDHARGFIAPFLDASLARASVFECPAQPWGTYRAQGPGARWITSTYGYNGYYLSPSRTPGWGAAISRRPWRRLSEIARPSDLLVFADTLLPGRTPSNNALLDPPMLYSGGTPGSGRWTPNPSPTTCFRHQKDRAGIGAVVAARADASAAATRARPEWLTHLGLGVGSMGTTNDPAYIPDWCEW